MENFATKEDIQRLERKLDKTQAEMFKYVIGGAYALQTVVLCVAMLVALHSIGKF
jgi:hypothetical protein